MVESVNSSFKDLHAAFRSRRQDSFEVLHANNEDLTPLGLDYLLVLSQVEIIPELIDDEICEPSSMEFVVPDLMDLTVIFHSAEWNPRSTEKELKVARSESYRRVQETVSGELRKLKDFFDQNKDTTPPLRIGFFLESIEKDEMLGGMLSDTDLISMLRREVVIGEIIDHSFGVSMPSVDDANGTYEAAPQQKLINGAHEIMPQSEFGDSSNFVVRRSIKP